MNIIKNHVFLMCSCKLIVKTLVFEGFAACVRERKRYQKTINNDTKIPSQIDDKFNADCMLEKVVEQI